MNCFSVSVFFCYFACKITNMGRIIGIISVVLTLTVLASCTDKRAMRERLDYVSQCNHADTVFTEEWLPTVDSLVNYFDRHGNANEKMMAHYLKGRVHHDMGEAPIALECYQQAVEMADTTRKSCDFHTLAAIYGQMADLFDAQFLPNDEIKALSMAERIDLKAQDTLSAIKSYELRIRPMFLKGETDSMILTMLETRRRYLQMGEKKNAAQSIYVMISILLDRNHIKEAKHYLDIYEKESGNFDKNGELIFGGAYYYDKGRYLLAIGQIDSARLYFNKALERGLFESGYKGLLSVYKAKRIPDSIVWYAEQFAKANDSSYLYVNQAKVHQVSAMYDYNRHQRIAEKKAHATSLLKRNIFIGVILLTALIFIGAFFIYKKQARTLTLINQLMSQRNTLKDELTKKGREIMDISQNHVIAQQHSKQQLEMLQLQIEQLRHQLEQDYNNVQEDKFQCCNSVKRLRAFLKPGSFNPIKNEDWQNLINDTSEYLPHFHRIIQQQKLSLLEQRTSILVRLGFLSKEIELLLQISSSRVANLKKSASIKLFGHGNTRDFHHNILKI